MTNKERAKQISECYGVGHFIDPLYEDVFKALNKAEARGIQRVATILERVKNDHLHAAFVVVAARIRKLAKDLTHD